MNKKTTSQILSERILIIDLSPQKVTLDKISQFARAYSFEKNLPAKLGSYYIN